MSKINESCEWCREIQRLIDIGGSIDRTTRQSFAAAWLIKKLSDAGRFFKVYNLGAGVRRITTETDICPCCKKKI